MALFQYEWKCKVKKSIIIYVGTLLYYYLYANDKTTYKF